jgi:hypothetical protein
MLEDWHEKIVKRKNRQNGYGVVTEI